MRRGFTLIELSIVLVIIGLIVGGVLVGRDLIQAASIRKEITQLEQFDSAVNTFRGKYNCLPGDCANASTFGFTGIWFDASGAGGDYPANGNGDGTISCINVTNCSGANVGWGPNGATTIGMFGEETVFWHHLYQAKLIAQPGRCNTWTGCAYNFNGQVTPTSFLPSISPTQGGIGIIATKDYNGGDANHRLAGDHNYMITYYPYPGAVGPVSPKEVYAVDAKLDDGLPQSGKVRAYQGNSTANPHVLTDVDAPNFWGDDYCVNTGVSPVTYHLQSNFGCSMFVRAAF